MPLSRETTGLSPGRFEDISAVLVLESRDGSDEGVCPELLGAEERGSVDLLRVAYRDPGAAVEAWTDRAGHPPANAVVVAVGDAAARAERSGNYAVEAVDATSDLTGVGITINRALSAWADDGRRTVVCVDSVTDLLRHVEVATAFEFLHILTRRLDAVGASAHCHLHPAAHDDRTVERLKPLFDAIVTVDDNVQVRTR